MKIRAILCAGLFFLAAAASTAQDVSFLPGPKLVTIDAPEGKRVVLLSAGRRAATFSKSVPSAFSKSAPIVFEKSAARAFSKPAPAALAKFAKSSSRAFVKTASFFGSPAAAKAASRGFTKSRAIAPGQAILLGPTASFTRTAAAPAATRLGVDTVVVTARSSAAAALPSPLSATIEREVFPGDLPRTTPREETSASGSAFAPGVALVIGPNGFPVPVTVAPQSGTNPIGPNGFPLPLTNGPQSGIQPIDANGFPAMNVAPFSQTGLTRAGPPRDSTAPVTSPASAAGAVSAGRVAVPGSAFGAQATTSAPAAGATTSTASPR